MGVICSDAVCKADCPELGLPYCTLQKSLIISAATLIMCPPFSPLYDLVPVNYLHPVHVQVAVSERNQKSQNWDNHMSITSS